MSHMLFDRKRNFQRLIVKTNAGSLTPERTKSLREKINDPNYLNHTIDLLADNLSKALSAGYLADPSS
ncbi:MAG: hypothetical protein ACRCVW_03465 [Brevinema sp.]